MINLKNYQPLWITASGKKIERVVSKHILVWYTHPQDVIFVKSNHGHVNLSLNVFWIRDGSVFYLGLWKGAFSLGTYSRPSRTCTCLGSRSVSRRKCNNEDPQPKNRSSTLMGIQGKIVRSLHTTPHIMASILLGTKPRWFYLRKKKESRGLKEPSIVQSTPADEALWGTILHTPASILTRVRATSGQLPWFNHRYITKQFNVMFTICIVSECRLTNVIFRDPIKTIGLLHLSSWYGV